MTSVNDWLNCTHKERYEKNKSYRIISTSGHVVLSEYSTEPLWWFKEVLHNRIVVNVEETDTQFIVTTRRKE